MDRGADPGTGRAGSHPVASSGPRPISTTTRKAFGYGQTGSTDPERSISTRQLKERGVGPRGDGQLGRPSSDSPSLGRRPKSIASPTKWRAQRPIRLTRCVSRRSSSEVAELAVVVGGRTRGGRACAKLVEVDVGQVRQPKPVAHRVLKRRQSRRMSPIGCVRGGRCNRVCAWRVG